MTRINTIHPADLLDQHLFIEFREITRIATMHRVLQNRERVREYVLGTGHMKFFYDKGLFLEKRLAALQLELTRRNAVNYTPKEYKTHIAGYHNDWRPTYAAHAANLTRLHEKLIMRPTFYTYCGKRVQHDFYINMLNHYVERPKQLEAHIESLSESLQYADHPQYGVDKAHISDARQTLANLQRSPYHGHI
jgi:deoxyribonuclease (pyrimidine dimer)